MVRHPGVHFARKLAPFRLGYANERTLGAEGKNAIVEQMCSDQCPLGESGSKARRG